MADIQQFIGDGVTNTITSIFTYVIWGVVILAIIIIGYKKYQDWKIFKNKVRVFRQRQNGTKIEINTKGGYIKSVAGITSFWIKIGRWKKFKMSSLPDPDAIDEENRIYYHQISPVDYIQTKAEFIYEDTFIENPNFIEPSFEKATEMIEELAKQLIESKEAETREKSMEIAMEKYKNWLDEQRGQHVNLGKVVYSPMLQSSKESCINDLVHAKGVLGIDVNKQFLYFVIGAVAILALGAIVFYIATNEGKIPILESFAPLLFFIKSKFK